MNPVPQALPIPWEAWTALATIGGLMLTLCGLLARAIWNLSEFVKEVRSDRTRTHEQIRILDRRVNRLHHRTTAIVIAGTQSATLAAFPSESKSEKMRNIDEWKRILPDEAGDPT